jgi:hypothetical protein
LFIKIIVSVCTVSVLVIPTTLTSLNKQPKGTVIVLAIPTTLAIIKTIVSVVCITKTITVPFDCLFRLL